MKKVKWQDDTKISDATLGNLLDTARERWTEAFNLLIKSKATLEMITVAGKEKELCQQLITEINVYLDRS